MSTLLLEKNNFIASSPREWIMNIFFTFVSCVWVTHFTFASILDSLIRVSRRVGYPSRNKIISCLTFCKFVHDLSSCDRFFHVQVMSSILNSPILCLEKSYRKHSWIYHNPYPFQPSPITFPWDPAPSFEMSKLWLNATGICNLWD